MVLKSRFYVYSQPANISMYVELTTAADTRKDCADIARSHMDATFGANQGVIRYDWDSSEIVDLGN